MKRPVIVAVVVGLLVSVTAQGETPEKPVVVAMNTPSATMDCGDGSLMLRLRERRTALDDRERQLNERDTALKAFEHELTLRTQKLESEIAALENRVGIGEAAGAAQRKRTEDIVGALSRLSPRKAAPIIARADTELAVQVLSRVPPENAIALLSQIDAGTAATLLGRLTALGLHKSKDVK